MFSIKLELISVVAKPEGGNRTLRVRILGRCIFNVFLTSNEKLFLIKCFVFNEMGAYLCCGEPKGRKPNAASQNPGSMYFNVCLTSHETLVSYQMPCFQLNWSLSPLWRTRREETERCESESGVDLFLTFS